MASSLKQIAGLKFANNSKSFLSLNKALSGFLENSNLSHFGPPTAPSKTASLSKAIFITLSVIGSPCLSKEIPPANSSVISKSADFFLLNQTIIFLTSFITSGPIPSPARIRSFFFINITKELDFFFFAQNY